MTFHPVIDYRELHRSKRQMPVDDGKPFTYAPENRERLEAIAKRYPDNPIGRRSARIAPKATDAVTAARMAGAGAPEIANPRRWSGAPRAPYCMMGVCFECLVTIDDVGNRRVRRHRNQIGTHHHTDIGVQTGTRILGPDDPLRARQHITAEIPIAHHANEFVLLNHRDMADFSSKDHVGNILDGVGDVHDHGIPGHEVFGF